MASKKDLKPLRSSIDLSGLSGAIVRDERGAEAPLYPYSSDYGNSKTA
jgi:hypothetical protein